MAAKPRSAHLPERHGDQPVRAPARLRGTALERDVEQARDLVRRAADQARRRRRLAPDDRPRPVPLDLLQEVSDGWGRRSWPKPYGRRLGDEGGVRVTPRGRRVGRRSPRPHTMPTPSSGARPLSNSDVAHRVRLRGVMAHRWTGTTVGPARRCRHAGMDLDGAHRRAVPLDVEPACVRPSFDDSVAQHASVLDRDRRCRDAAVAAAAPRAVALAVVPRPERAVPAVDHQRRLHRYLDHALRARSPLWPSSRPRTARRRWWAGAWVSAGSWWSCSPYTRTRRRCGAPPT